MEADSEVISEATPTSTTNSGADEAPDDGSAGSTGSTDGTLGSAVDAVAATATAIVGGAAIANTFVTENLGVGITGVTFTGSTSGLKTVIAGAIGVVATIGLCAVVAIYATKDCSAEVNGPGVNVKIVGYKQPNNATAGPV